MQIAQGSQPCESKYLLGFAKVKSKPKPGADFSLGRSQLASFCPYLAEKCPEAAQFYTSAIFPALLLQILLQAALYTMG